MGPVLPGCSSTLQKTPDHLPQIGAWCDLVVTRPSQESHITRRLSIGADLLRDRAICAAAERASSPSSTSAASPAPQVVGKPNDRHTN